MHRLFSGNRGAGDKTWGSLYQESGRFPPTASGAQGNLTTECEGLPWWQRTQRPSRSRHRFVPEVRHLDQGLKVLAQIKFQGKSYKTHEQRGCRERGQSDTCKDQCRAEQHWGQRPRGKTLLMSILHKFKMLLFHSSWVFYINFAFKNNCFKIVITFLIRRFLFPLNFVLVSCLLDLRSSPGSDFTHCNCQK